VRRWRAGPARTLYDPEARPEAETGDVVEGSAVAGTHALSRRASPGVAGGSWVVASSVRPARDQVVIGGA